MAISPTQVEFFTQFVTLGLAGLICGFIVFRGAILGANLARTAIIMAVGALVTAILFEVVDWDTGVQACQFGFGLCATAALKIGYRSFRAYRRS